MTQIDYQRGGGTYTWLTREVDVTPRSVGMRGQWSSTAQGENEGERLERREAWVQPLVHLEPLSRNLKCGSGNRACTFFFQGSWWQKETILEAVACCGQGEGKHFVNVGT